MRLAHNRDGVRLYHGDARDAHGLVHALGVTPALVIVDPPYDDRDACRIGLPAAPARLVFTDPRRLGATVLRYGPPAWVFTWDTMSSWQAGERRPLTQTKFALFHGGWHDDTRDAGGIAAARQNRQSNPSTRRRVDGAKALPDIWRESLRWLHEPGTARPGDGRGAERFANRATNHAKPVGWLRYLIATCSPGGLVLDPFAGTGTTLLAARLLGRPAVGIELDADTAALACARLEGHVGDPEQTTLDVRA